MGIERPDGGYSASVSAWLEVLGYKVPLAIVNGERVTLAEPFYELTGKEATLVVSVDGNEDRRRIRITGEWSGNTKRWPMATNLHPMTRADLRRDLSAFRAMVRERGPRECLEVAAVRWVQWCGSETDTEEAARFWVWSRSSLAALRWWRWANRGRRYVLVREVWGKTDEDIWYEDLYF